jgi:hypothetical protein
MNAHRQPGVAYYRGKAVRPAGRLLTETATLDPGLAQQLAVLLLGHPLAALLDHRAHIFVPLNTLVGLAVVNSEAGAE